MSHLVGDQNEMIGDVGTVGDIDRMMVELANCQHDIDRMTQKKADIEAKIASARESGYLAPSERYAKEQEDAEKKNKAERESREKEAKERAEREEKEILARQGFNAKVAEEEKKVAAEAEAAAEDKRAKNRAEAAKKEAEAAKAKGEGK